MADDALTQAEKATTPEIEPYEPFPAFSDWLTTPFDGTTVDKFVARLADLRDSVDQGTLDAAVQIATNWAAINTGALEGLYEVDRGFTYSVASSAAVWQEIEQEKGQFAADSISDAMKAYEFVLDAATGAHPVSEKWIRDLHAKVAASQKTYTVITAVGSQEHDLPKGEYKTYPNNPFNFRSHTIHSYASPLDTGPEMARLIAELRSDAFLSASPALQAAYAHYAFVCVHPFADGNGRVARALGSTFLYRGIGVPLVIFADQKGDYLDCLELADKGSPERFVRFVSERVIDTIGMIREGILTASVPDVSTQIDELMPMLTGHGGLAHSDIDAIIPRVLETFAVALDKQVRENPLGGPLNATAERVGRPATGVSGYRGAPGYPPSVDLIISSSGPAKVRVVRSYASYTRLPSHDDFDFAVFDARGSQVVSADLREVHPTISQAFVYRAETAALRQLRELTAEAAHKAEQALRNAGYL